MSTIDHADLGLTRPIKSFGLNADEMGRVLWRHALAAAFVKGSHTEWTPDESLFIRIFSLGQPGQHSVELPNRSELYSAAEHILGSHLTVIRRLSRQMAGRELLDFVEKLQKETVVHKRSMAQMFGESRQINQDILDEAAWTTDKLFAIKVSADVAFNGLLVLSGVGFAAGLGAGSAYSLTTQLLMSRNEIDSADILAFSISTGEALLPTGVAIGGSALGGVASEIATGQAKAVLQRVRMALSFEAASLANTQLDDTLRRLPTGTELGVNRPSLGQAQRGVHVAKGLGQGVGFVASIYFMKDDIAKAISGYSASLEHAY